MATIRASLPHGLDARNLRLEGTEVWISTADPRADLSVLLEGLVAYKYGVRARSHIVGEFGRESGKENTCDNLSGVNGSMGSVGASAQCKYCKGPLQGQKKSKRCALASLSLAYFHHTNPRIILNPSRHPSDRIKSSAPPNCVLCDAYDYGKVTQSMRHALEYIQREKRILIPQALFLTSPQVPIVTIHSPTLFTPGKNYLRNGSTALYCRHLSLHSPDLRHILDERYPSQAAKARFTRGESAGVYAQSRTKRNEVTTDLVYQLEDEIKILWDDKSPKVLDGFIGEPMYQIRAPGLVLNLCSKPSSTTFKGYEAILSNYEPTDQQEPAPPSLLWRMILRQTLPYLSLWRGGFTRFGIDAQGTCAQEGSGQPEKSYKLLALGQTSRGRPSVHGSSKSRVIVKLPAVPEQDKALNASSAMRMPTMKNLTSSSDGWPPLVWGICVVRRMVARSFQLGPRGVTNHSSTESCANPRVTVWRAVLDSLLWESSTGTLSHGSGTKEVVPFSED
ncbi:hypothetical protein BJV74DRAFT_796692 [Russula compacta]|nr:hypothetical protein BJV74DRAFT_796692 [Russula compacta]